MTPKERAKYIADLKRVLELEEQKRQNTRALIRELAETIEGHHYATDKFSGGEVFVCIGCGRNPCNVGDRDSDGIECSIQMLLTRAQEAIS
jgi:hypothetical protein